MILVDAGPLVALIAGILILAVPRLLNYIVALYLIIIGVIGLFGVTLAILTLTPGPAFTGIVIAYLLAWSGHFFIENRRPAGDKHACRGYTPAAINFKLYSSLAGNALVARDSRILLVALEMGGHSAIVVCHRRHRNAANAARGFLRLARLLRLLLGLNWLHLLGLLARIASARRWKRD